MLVLTRKKGQEIVFNGAHLAISLRVISFDEDKQKASFQLIPLNDMESTAKEDAKTHGPS